jgi:hypothetical protein
MPVRVNPVVLLGLIIVSVLSIGVLATARSGGGGSASDALAAAESQLGKPFVMSTDGPDTFSCVGLMRYALRTAGVDSDAPWVPEEYLSRYAPVAAGDLQPGDIVIYPGWATMYAGNGQLINANEMEGFVTHTSMDAAGEPLGIVRPYGGQPLAEQLLPSATQYAPVDPTTDPMPAEQLPGQLPGQLPVDEQQLPVVNEQLPMTDDPALAVDPAPVTDPMPVDDPITDPALAVEQQPLPVADPAPAQG